MTFWKLKISNCLGRRWMVAGETRELMMNIIENI